MCIDDVSVDCFFYEDGFFYQECLGFERYRVSYVCVTSFDAYYVGGKFVDFEDFYFLLDKVSFSQDYKRTCRLYSDAWASDTYFYSPVGAGSLCVSSSSQSSLPVEPEVSGDRVVAESLLGDVAPIEMLLKEGSLVSSRLEGAAPIELLIEDGCLMLHRGLWNEECWYSEECLYFWAYDKDGYEVAMCMSIYDVDLTFVNGWSFTQEQVVEYFGLYRMTFEREMAVSPLIINHYCLEPLTLEFVPARFFVHTETVAELALSSNGILTFRYPYSSEYLICSVSGGRVITTDGTEVCLNPSSTLITLFKDNLTGWLITLSHVLKGSYS